MYLTIFTILGRTFWGKKTSSSKKKLMWQLGTQGAPVPMITGIPVWVGRMAEDPQLILNIQLWDDHCTVTRNVILLVTEEAGYRRASP